jgi:hypothetical protein
VAALTVVAEGDSDDSMSKFFESDDSGSSIVWMEGSSEEDLDYFAAVDVAAMETPPLVMGAKNHPGASAGRRRRRVVAKRRVGELSRGERRHHGEMEGGRLRADGTGKWELLSLSAGASVGEGELRSLFASEELRIMLFNYREMGIIPKVEPM